MIFHDVPPCSEWNADQWKSIIIYVDKQRGLTQGRLCPKAAAQCSTRCHPNLRSLVLQSDRINYKQKGASKPIEMTPAKPPLQTRYERSSSMPGWLSGNYQTRTFHLFAVHRFTGLPSIWRRATVRHWKSLEANLLRTQEINDQNKSSRPEYPASEGMYEFPQRCGFTWRYDQNFKRIKKGWKEWTSYQQWVHTIHMYVRT